MIYQSPVAIVQNYFFQAYFGGTVECQAQVEDDDRFDQKDLICGGCSNKERDQVYSILELKEGLSSRIVV